MANPAGDAKEKGEKEDNLKKRQRLESAPSEVFTESPDDRSGGYGPSSGPVNPHQMDGGGELRTKRPTDLDDYEMGVMKRKMEESRGMKRIIQGEEPEMKRQEGESQGRIDKSVDLDSIQADEWEAIKDTPVGAAAVAASEAAAAAMRAQYEKEADEIGLL